MVFKGKNPGPHLVSLVRNCCTVVGGRGQGLFPQTQKGLLFMGEGKCLEMAVFQNGGCVSTNHSGGEKIILMSAKKLESCETAANCNAVEEKFSRLGIFPTLLSPPSTRARSMGPVLNSRNCQSSFVPFLPGFTQRTSACCTKGIYEGISLFFREKKRRLRRRRHK